MAVEIENSLESHADCDVVDRGSAIDPVVFLLLIVDCPWNEASQNGMEVNGDVPFRLSPETFSPSRLCSIDVPGRDFGRLEAVLVIVD